MKRSIPYIIGIGELQRQASSIIQAVEDKYGEGFVVSHNEPKAVLISLKRYEQLKALEEDEILSRVQKGNEEFKKDKILKKK